MIPKKLFSNSENISFIYFTHKITNNLPNTGNSEKNIEHIIHAARDYDKGNIKEEEITGILRKHSTNPPEWTKQNTLNNNGNNNEPHQEN